MKFAGLGLSQLIVIWVILSGITVGAKVLVNKYNPKGLTEIVNSI
jgi:hypothetical protein